MRLGLGATVQKLNAEEERENALSGPDYPPIGSVHPSGPRITPKPFKPSTSQPHSAAKRAKLVSPSESSLSPASNYTKDGVRASQVDSNLQLHEIMRFEDRQSGQHYIQVYIRLFTDMNCSCKIISDGCQLLYMIRPKYVDAGAYVDPEHPEITYQPTAAFVNYFHTDTGAEQFRYLINLPDAVDYNPVKSRFVYRLISVDDVNGKEVEIEQKVGRVLVYAISGQQDGCMMGDW
ncbi:hypothetical protein BJ741DRAFT_579918 [Chytriomyces cf. hyalinus JEL632]|nr:hypothetical protein BJ741DRAFT_579918 [Chytriomyces cf. hyalinus JEL632]